MINFDNLTPQLKTIKKIYNDKSKLSNLMSYFTKCTVDNTPITDNPMMDGVAIGWLFRCEYIIESLFNENRIQPIMLTDATHQYLEKCLSWLHENIDDILINMMDFENPYKKECVYEMGGVKYMRDDKSGDITPFDYHR